MSAVEAPLRTRIATAGLVLIAALLPAWWLHGNNPTGLPWYAFLLLYIWVVLYALGMRSRGDSDATAAILIAVFVPPLAAVLFALQAVDRGMRSSR